MRWNKSAQTPCHRTISYTDFVRANSMFAALCSSNKAAVFTVQSESTSVRLFMQLCTYTIPSSGVHLIQNSAEIWKKGLTDLLLQGCWPSVRLDHFAYVQFSADLGAQVECQWFQTVSLSDGPSRTHKDADHPWNPSSNTSSRAWSKYFWSIAAVHLSAPWTDPRHGDMLLWKKGRKKKRQPRLGTHKCTKVTSLSQSNRHHLPSSRERSKERSLIARNVTQLRSIQQRNTNSIWVIFIVPLSVKNDSISISDSFQHRLERQHVRSDMQESLDLPAIKRHPGNFAFHRLESSVV